MVPRRASSAAPPRYARRFVALFLATVISCAVFGVNAWPFSSWMLFSRLRSDRQVGWEAAAVDSAGRERTDPIAVAGHGYKGFGLIMDRFPTRAASERDAICQVWLRAATKQVDPDTRVLRIYRLDWLLSNREGRRAAPARQRLAWVCGSGGAHAAS